MLLQCLTKLLSVLFFCLCWHCVAVVGRLQGLIELISHFPVMCLQTLPAQPCTNLCQVLAAPAALSRNAHENQPAFWEWNPQPRQRSRFFPHARAGRLVQQPRQRRSRQVAAADSPDGSRCANASWHQRQQRLPGSCSRAARVSDCSVSASTPASAQPTEWCAGLVHGVLPCCLRTIS